MEGNNIATTEKFGLPFDVDLFAAAFPKRWTLVQDVDETERTLLNGPDGSIIVAGAHKISASRSLAEHVREFADNFDTHSEISEYKTKIGTTLWTLSFQYEEADEQKTAVMVEVAGPMLYSVRFIYFSEQIDQDVVETLIASARELSWIVTLPEQDPKSKNLTLKELRKLVKSKLKKHPDQRDSLLSSLEDEDEITLGAFDLEEIIDIGPECYSLAVSIIDFALRNVDMAVEDLCLSAIMCDVGCLNDSTLGERLIIKAEHLAATTSDFLSLAKISDSGIIHMESSSFYYNKAIESVKDIDDVFSAIDNDLCNEDDLKKLLARLEENIDDAEFHDGAFNVVDCLNAADERRLIDDSLKRKYLELFSQSSSKALPFMAMAASVDEEKNMDLRTTYLNNAMSRASTIEEKFEIYEFLKDELDDEQLAQDYLNDHRSELGLLLEEKEQEEKQKGIIDSLCQCALIVSVADGTISKKESDEVEQMHAFIDMIFRNRQAIELLEITGDLEKARAARRGLHLTHTLNMFGPDYLNEVIELLQDVENEEDFTALVRSYAGKIHDPFARKIGAWAAQIVAAVDGLDVSKLVILDMLANLWELDLCENDRYIRDVVMPAISDENDFADDDNGMMNASELTEQLHDLNKSSGLDVESLEENNQRQSVLDQHFSYQNDIERYYKDRANPESLQRAIQACRDQISLAGEAALAFEKESTITSPGYTLPQHYGYIAAGYYP